MVLTMFFLLGIWSARAETVTWLLTNPGSSPAGTGLTFSPASGTGYTAFNQTQLGCDQVSWTGFGWNGATNCQRVKTADASRALPLSFSTSVYVEYAVTAAASYNLIITSIDMYIGGGGTTSIYAQIKYSTDDFATSTTLDAGTTNLQSNTATVIDHKTFGSKSIPVASGATFKVRVYPKNTGGASTTKYLINSNVNITFNAFIPPAITSVSAPSTSICASATQTLTANGVAGSNPVVTWWTATGGTGTNLGTGTTLTGAGPGTYYARVTADYGTPVESSITVGIAPAPTISVQPKSVNGSYSKFETADALTLTAANAVTYQWYSSTDNSSTTSGDDIAVGTNSNSYTPSTDAVGILYYYCVVAGSCVNVTSNVATIEVTPNDRPSLRLTSGSATQNVISGSPIGSFIYSSAGSTTDVQVTWSGSSVVTPSGITVDVNPVTHVVTISGTPTVAGTYNVSIRSTDGVHFSTPSTGAITVNLNTPTVSAPSVPTSVGFTANWSDVTGESSYTLMIYQGATLVKTIENIAANSTSSVVTGLSANTTYTCTVTAIGDGVLVSSSAASTNSSGIRTLNSAKAIIDFTITGQISSSVNETAKTILVLVPMNTVASSLTPSAITTSQYSSVNPASGVAQNFTSPVEYTVTAEDGTQQVYTVTVGTASSVTDYFRTKATGNWNSAATWQSSPNSGTDWYDATIFPDASAGSVTVLHNVMYNGTPATISNATVNSGATLTNTTTSIAVASSKVLTIASGATFENQIDNAIITAGSGSMQVNGIYKYTNSTSGGNLTFTNVVFASSSTLYIGGTGAPRIPASVAGSVEWASTSGGSFLNSATNTIAGNFTLSNVAPLNHGTGGTGRALTISGNMIISNGVYNPQGGTGASQDLTVNGNVILSGAGKLYAVNPTAAGVGNVTVKGNLSIQSPTDVALGAGGGTSGAFKFGGTTQQTLSSDNSSGYAIDAVTNTNAVGVLINSDLTVGTITNNASSILGVAAGKQLTVSTALVNNGTLNLASSELGTATILTPTTISGSGTYTIQQYLTGSINSGTSLPNGRFWYVSSPVSVATSAVFDPTSGNKLWSFSESAGAYTPISDGSASLAIGKSYVARMKANTTLQFAGTPNNGEIIVNVTRDGATSFRGFDLIGNPYPSYLDWKNAVKTDLLPSMWFRTSNVAGTAMVFDTYNAVSDEATGNGVRGLVNRFIPPMQGFWVKAQTNGVTGHVTFNNALRSQQSGNLLRSAETSAEKSVIRLQVSNGSDIDQTVLAFMDGATDALDAYDSEKMFNNVESIPEIFTVASSTDVAINGMSPFSGSKSLALGFNTAQAGTFSIQANAITNMEGKVTLIDNLLKVSQNLVENPVYTFHSEAASGSDRFTVVIEKMATSLINTIKASAQAFVREDGRIQVETAGLGNNQASISVYSVAGQLLTSAKTNNASCILKTILKPGLYIVTVSAEGLHATQKVIIN